MPVPEPTQAAVTYPVEAGPPVTRVVDPETGIEYSPVEPNKPATRAGTIVVEQPTEPGQPPVTYALEPSRPGPRPRSIIVEAPQAQGQAPAQYVVQPNVPTGPSRPVAVMVE